MRKAFLLFLALCLLPLFVSADITRQEAEEMALQYFLEKEQIKKEDLKPYKTLFSAEQQDWYVGFLPVLRQENTEGVYFVILDKQGGLKELVTPRLLSPSQQLLRDVNQQFDGLVDTQVLLALKEKWSPQFAAILKAEDERERQSDARYHRVKNIVWALSQGIRLPVEGEISQEEALKSAQEIIANTPPFSKEKLAYYTPMIAAHYVSNQLHQPVWYLLFQRESASKGRFSNQSWEVYEKDYLKPLEKLFSGAENTPLFVCLRLDAKTGELQGEVFCEYPQPLVTTEFYNMQ